MLQQTLSNYKVTAKLGEGGMGEVYVAEHVMMGKRAAIKTLRREFCANAEIVDRFFNEARSATMIKHPGIVDIYDFGHHADGSAYIVMELLEGEELSKRLAGGRRLPPAEIAELGAQVADALAAAHAAGIVHRDLKPDNIFLCPDGAVFGGHRVKILDFGIAKLTSDQMAATSHTRTGALMGTPAYMAPEQCRGASAVDHRADIYALGCILFEMACGRPPFVKQGLGEMLAAHMGDAPPRVRELRDDVDPPMASLIDRLLAKNPGDRVQRVAEVGDVLRGRRRLQSAPIAAPTDATISGDVVSPLGVTVAPMAHTTLGAAASQIETRAPARRAKLPLVIGAGVVVAGAVAAVLALGGGRGGAADSAAAAAEPVAQPIERSPAPPPAAETPARVTLELTSTPSNAAVYRVADGARVGQTPWRKELPQSDGTLDLVLRLDGYRAREVSLSLGGDAVEAVELEALVPERSARQRPKPRRGRDEARPPDTRPASNQTADAPPAVAKTSEPKAEPAPPAPTPKPEPEPDKPKREWGGLAD